MKTCDCFCSDCGRWCGCAINEDGQPRYDFKCDNCKDGAISPEQVKDAVHAAGITTIETYPCSITGEMMYYSIRGDEVTYWDTSWHQPRSWADLAAWINMQSDPKHRVSVAAKFGLALEA